LSCVKAAGPEKNTFGAAPRNQFSRRRAFHLGKEDVTMLDCAIIGTGPAGLSAAINLKLHNKEFAWFGSKAMSEKVRLSEKVANYPGLPMVSGAELARRFQDHAGDMGLKITDKMVSQIMPGRGKFTLLADNDIYEAGTLILAMGVVTARTLPGEAELVGHGVSYCATCDGFLYKGKTIGIVCTAKRFEHEIEYLAQLADRVYLFAQYQGCAVQAQNVERMDKAIAAVGGGRRLASLTLKDGAELAVDGLFCLRDAIAPTTLLPGLAVEKGQITVDRAMATSIPGCYACGDCTGAPYQFAKAVGEGNVAAHSVIQYLAQKEGKE